VEPHQGVLLYGPPGNGKTLIAKAVAGEANAHLEIINGPEVLSKWVGESEANLRNIFGRAKALAPSVVLIDEIDALAGTRNKVTHQHEISLISQLLVLLDGLEARGKIAVIATTNRVEALDPALRRPGRFDYHIEVSPPDLSGRQAILNVHLSKLKLAEAIIPARLAEETDGFSGAELAALCREAGLLAIRRALKENLPASETRVLRDDLIAAIQSIKGKRILEQ
jgi:transitional endoplasmic reticulum ATPase